MKRAYSQIDLDERRKAARWRQLGMSVGCCHVVFIGRNSGLCRAMSMTGPTYKNHRYQIEVVARAVWLYFRFDLSRVFMLDRAFKSPDPPHVAASEAGPPLAARPRFFTPVQTASCFGADGVPQRSDL